MLAVATAGLDRVLTTTTTLDLDGLAAAPAEL